jgi:uncharacterized protein YoxC
MFYQAEKIDSILICKICENKMVDPRLLPCGKSVCHRCVDILADTDKKRIKCENCAKIHEIPEEGFPKILALQELLECEAKEVSHPYPIRRFRKLLDILNASKESIKSTLECGDAKIRDHCDKVRNDMQLAIEQAHAKLDEFHKDFMDEIDNHEKECQAKFKTIQQNKADIEKALHESNELLSKSNHLLKQLNINQTELSILSVSVHSLQTKLEQIKDEIQKEMFNESLLKFEKPKSFDSNVIGKIVKQNIELYFLENIENMRVFFSIFFIDLSTSFPCVQPYKSHSYLYLYSDINYGHILNIQCFDRDGNTLFETNDLIKNREIEENTILNFASSNNKIIFICTEEKHKKHKKIFYNLRSFDEVLDVMAEIKLDKKPNDFGVNGENLFILNKNENFCTISMYNDCLEIVRTFGQENSTLPFFFPPKKSSFLVSNQYFFIYETLVDDDEDDADDEYHNSVTIINRSNGLVESTFIIYQNFHQLLLYLEKFLITFNKWTRFLKCYNFKGDLLHKITLDKKLGGSIISVINKELFFNDSVNETVFII